MNRLISRKLTAGFGLACIVMLGNDWISYQILRKISGNQPAVDQMTITLSLDTVLGLGLLLSLYLLIRRDLAARQQAQAALQERENHLRAILDAEPDCVKVVAADGSLLEMNPAGLAMVQAPDADAVIGQSVYPLIAPEHRAAFQQMHRRVCQGSKETLEFEIVTQQGNRRWVETHAVPLKSTVDDSFVQLAVTQDITQRKQAEVELYRLNCMLTTLLDCNQALVRAEHELDLLQRVCQVIVSRGGYQLAWIGFAEQDEAKTIRPVVQSGDEASYLQHLSLTWAETASQPEPASAAIRSGQPVVRPVVQSELAEPQATSWQQEALDRGYAAAIALPLLSGQQPWGALSIYAAEADAFDAAEISLLSELAEDLSYGILALRNRRDRQLAEIALQENEERLRLALNAAQIGLWDWNILTDQIIWSVEHERLFGLAPGTFDGSYRAFNACVHPEDRESVVQVVNHARAEKTDYCHQYRMVWPDGSIHWIESRGKLYSNAADEVVRILGTVVDISIRKQAEIALRAEKRNLELRVAERTVEMLQVNKQLQKELNQRQKMQADLQLSQAQFAGILDIAEDAIISIDRQQQITLFNQGAERIFGYAAAEVLGQPLDILLPTRFAQLHHQHVTDFKSFPVQARRMGERREIFGRRKDGSEFPAEASISKLATGQEMLFTVFLQDITERSQIDRMKDEFVSVVSHELRTPLTSIHGSLGMLASGLLQPDSEQGKRMLQIAVDSTDRLVRLINDILDIERIESGRVQMEKQLCQLEDLITEAVNIVQPLADHANVTLSITSSALQVQADPDRIIQTLTNLLSNAIKFSASGSTIWLTAERQANDLLVMVKDQGCGIPDNKLDSIFERFQQVDSSNSRNHEGTGLGLAICRSIVQQHDGKIWVESRLGEGSSFYFTLPVEPPHRQQAAPLVLICESDPTLCTRLQTLLQQHHYRVATALGQDVITQATAQQPAVILLGLMSPDLSGWQLLSQLKEQPETQHIPIMICSLCAETPSQADACVDWTSQPLDESLLLQSLSRVLAKSPGKIQVLIVEDDQNLAEVLVTLFEQHFEQYGVTAFHAKTGQEAIRLSQQIRPDLLVLDVVLPEGDGFTVVKWLQQEQQLQEIPLIVYSGKDLDISERNRLKLGPTEFLSKGQVTIQEFEQRVIALLEQVTETATELRVDSREQQ